jgi:hypothetical protein
MIKGSKVLIMCLTYKETVSDTRESPVREMMKGFEFFLLAPVFFLEKRKSVLMRAGCLMKQQQKVLLSEAPASMKLVILDNNRCNEKKRGRNTAISAFLTPKRLYLFIGTIVMIDALKPYLLFILNYYI